MNTRLILRFAFLALFALVFAGWLRADSSHARIIRLSLVQGDVRFARDVHGDPLTSDKANWEGATLNLPIRQGYVLATDHGRAEVEFENGAMAFLSENTVLEFYDLSLEDGAKTTRLVLRQGTASFYVNPGNGDYFSVTGGDFTVEADGRAAFRLDNFDDGSVVDVTKGRISVLRKNKTTALVKGQSLSMRADDNNSMEIARLPESDDFDRWVSGREDAVTTATNAGQQYVNSSYYSSGIADLYTYGSWYPVSGYGNCWRPYGVGLGWSPFASGGWFVDPVFGSTFIGGQPWGWLPYHYGGWVFDPLFGWLWSPGFGFGFGGPVFRPVTGVFIRSKTGLIGLVPVSLWRLGIRPAFWMAVVAGVWLWLWGSGVPAGYGSFHPLENGFDWAGAGASPGCARQRADQSGKGSLSGCRRDGCAASNGKHDCGGRELEGAESSTARVADEYRGGDVCRAGARFAHDRRWRQQRTRGHYGPQLFDCV